MLQELVANAHYGGPTVYPVFNDVSTNTAYPGDYCCDFYEANNYGGAKDHLCATTE